MCHTAIYVWLPLFLPLEVFWKDEPNRERYSSSDIISMIALITFQAHSKLKLKRYSTWECGWGRKGIGIAVWGQLINDIIAYSAGFRLHNITIFFLEEYAVLMMRLHNWNEINFTRQLIKHICGLAEKAKASHTSQSSSVTIVNHNY